jgi:PIN domain nuclease of toxin-antitoxin system
MGKSKARHALLDTHALVWWLAGRVRSLGRDARSFVERVDAGEAVAHIPTMALVELSEAIRRGVFTLGEPFDVFVQRLEHTPSRYRVVPLDAAVVARSHELFAIPERGDRLIAATAQHLGLPLVTRDPEIARVMRGEVIW